MRFVIQPDPVETRSAAVTALAAHHRRMPGAASPAGPPSRGRRCPSPAATISYRGPESRRLMLGSVSSRTNDGILSSKVKASFVDSKDLQAQAAKVVTERGVVYLMGRVTEREANRFADVARSVNGVQKVVKVFEVISEAELARLVPSSKP